MAPRCPVFVGLAGPSGAGKSTLCAAIAGKMPGVLHFKLDDFFKDATDFPMHGKWLNRELPTNLKIDEFRQALLGLRDGRTVVVPDYSMKDDRQIGTKRIVPQPIVLVEGYLLFFDDAINGLFDVRVFIDVDWEVQRARRKERGITFDELGYFDEVVVPMFERYGRPAMDDAHYIMDGNKEKSEVEREFTAIIDEATRIAV